MTTTLAPQPATTGPGDPDTFHLVCCSTEIAMCGEDVSGDNWTDGEGETPCPLCAWVEDANLPCPVPGCPYQPNVPH